MENKIISPINKNIITNTRQPVQQELKKSKAHSKAIKGLSVAAGLCITALVTGGLMYRNKLHSVPFNILKLNGEIDFKEAQTLKEAMEYGTRKLGIKNYNGFEENDLDVINWVNEGLTACANKAKTKGQIVMPIEVTYSNKLADYKTNSLTSKALASVNANGTLDINKKELSKFKEAAIKIIKDTEGKQEEKDAIIKKLTMKDALDYVIGYFDIQGELKDFGLSMDEAFSIIYHEMGHLQHMNNLKSMPAFRSLGKSFERPKKLSKGAKELLELFGSKKDTTIKKVSSYAQESPDEFVAEVYSQLCSGKKLDNDIIDLYKKFGGVL